jgi:hypothetical protein
VADSRPDMTPYLNSGLYYLAAAPLLRRGASFTPPGRRSVVIDYQVDRAHVNRLTSIRVLVWGGLTTASMGFA